MQKNNQLTLTKIHYYQDLTEKQVDRILKKHYVSELAELQNKSKYFNSNNQHISYNYCKRTEIIIPVFFEN